MSAKILWGSEPPRHIANPGPAQMLYLGTTQDDLCPGLLTLSGGVRSFKYRLEQEERMFATFVYFSGFKVPAFKAAFQIWNEPQYEELLRLYEKYAPRPLLSLRGGAVQVTNPILNEHKYRMMLINDWAPPVAPEVGLSYVYSFTLLEAFPRRFVPKPPSASDKDKGLVRDVPQDTKRAINPNAELERKWNAHLLRSKEPAAVYQTPAKPLVQAPPNMSSAIPETPYSDYDYGVQQ